MTSVRFEPIFVGAPQFERLSRLYDQLEEENMPGGPPMSPVYDSYLSQHVLAEVPLYRVTHALGLSAQLEPLRGGPPLSVRLTGPFLGTDDRILARVVPFGGGHFIADSPYLLRASEQDWLEYLERVSGAEAVPLSNGAERPEEKRSGRRSSPVQSRSSLS